MGILKYYKVVNNYAVTAQVPVPPPVKKKREFSALALDARRITLARYNPTAFDFTKAHKISDYRKKRFNFFLLPDIKIPLDSLLTAETAPVRLNRDVCA